MKKALLSLFVLFCASYAHSYSIIYSTDGAILQACECKQSLSGFPVGARISTLSGHIPSGGLDNYRFYGSSIGYKSSLELAQIAGEKERERDILRMEFLGKRRQQLEYSIAYTTKTKIKEIYQSQLNEVIEEYNILEGKY